MTYDYSRYNLETGRFTGRGSNLDQANVTAKDGEGIIEGFYDPSTQMVQSGAVVSIPENIVSQEQTDSAWSDLRSVRSEMLKFTDWTQVSDAPVDASSWAVYRQALRDLPETTTDPLNVEWPEKPTT